MPFLAVGLTLWWINAVHGETRVYAEKARDVYLLLAVSDYVWEQLSPLLHLGLVLCPLAWGVWGALPRRAIVSTVVGLGGFTGLLIWYKGAVPYPLDGLLTWNELGLGRITIDGQVPHRHIPQSKFCGSMTAAIISPCCRG